MTGTALSHYRALLFRLYARPAFRADECCPNTRGMPNLFHPGPRLRLVDAEHIAAISIKEGRNPIVGDAVDMHRYMLQLLHHRTELGEVLGSRVLEIRRDMDVDHAQ